MSRKVIVDLEMTGLSMKDKMISLAALDMESGKLFYAESLDWSFSDITQDNANWMKQHVIDQLLFDSDIKTKLRRGLLDEENIFNIFPELYNINIKGVDGCIHLSDTKLTEVVLGNNKTICTKLCEWLAQLLSGITLNIDLLTPYTNTPLFEIQSEDDDIIFLMDVGHYDFVFLCELFGGVFNLPPYIQPLYHDINYDIARVNKCKLQEAFDLNREFIAMSKDPSRYTSIGKNYPLFKLSEQHNAANDVIVSNIILT